MRGETDRECRARGGQVTKDDRKAVKKSFYSTKPKTGAVDATLKRGKGIFRKRGGKVDKEMRSDESEEFKRGGKVEGKAKKPHMGRAGRARGGAAGSELRPLTSADSPAKAKDLHTMPESEATP